MPTAHGGLRRKRADARGRVYDGHEGASDVRIIQEAPQFFGFITGRNTFNFQALSLHTTYSEGGLNVALDTDVRNRFNT